MRDPGAVDEGIQWGNIVFVLIARRDSAEGRHCGIFVPLNKTMRVQNASQNDDDPSQDILAIAHRAGCVFVRRTIVEKSLLLTSHEEANEAFVPGRLVNNKLVRLSAVSGAPLSNLIANSGMRFDFAVHMSRPRNKLAF